MPKAYVLRLLINDKTRARRRNEGLQPTPFLGRGRPSAHYACRLASARGLSLLRAVLFTRARTAAPQISQPPTPPAPPAETGGAGETRDREKRRWSNSQLCRCHDRFVTLKTLPCLEQLAADLTDPALRQAETLRSGGGAFAVGKERGNLPQASGRNFSHAAKSIRTIAVSAGPRAGPQPKPRSMPLPPNRSDRAAGPGGFSAAGSSRWKRRGR